jgi:hypothetical protein
MDADKMLVSLKQSFQQKIPGGLTEEATARLTRTLHHFLQQGGSEQDIMRETYSSMTNWFKRHTAQLVPRSKPQQKRLEPSTMSSFDGISDYTTGITMPEEDEENPLDKFERLKALRAKGQDVPLTVSPVDLLNKHDDIIKYRETEYNLVLNSKDRDWVTNTQENRYNFSVQLDSGVRPQGTGSQATLTNRFRNITKIEFVKVILPVEGLDGLILPTSEISTVTVLSTPFITVIMDEMTGNNYGTNDIVDKSLAVCQYDATWKTDTRLQTLNKGFTLFFPKFMKAQRIYSPTPLASLQKMSFKLMNPENILLSTIPDAVNISDISFGTLDGNGNYISDTSNNYVFIQTKVWFPTWSFAALDRIQMAGLEGLSTDFLAWLQQAKGHIIVGICGSNAVGYANTLVIRNRFQDPTTGGSSRLRFSEEPGVLRIDQGAVINVSRQVQLTLRITVREMDSATHLRPGNI